MKHIWVLVLALCCITFYAHSVTYYTYTNGGSAGNWSNASTWTTDPTGLTLTASAVPANTDVVVILNGYTVTLTANVTTTGHSVIINAGGTLDLSTFAITALSTLSGSGTLRIGSGYFPAVTTNNLATTNSATVEYYNFTGNIPASIHFPNLVLRNTLAANHTMNFANTAAYSRNIIGNFTTIASGSGSLTVAIGTQAGNATTTTVSRNITIGANTLLRAGAFNSIHSLVVEGNMTNNGTVDFSNGTQWAASTTGAVQLSFTGTSDNTLACNGPTQLYSLNVNKGTSSAYTLSVTSTNVANLEFYSPEFLITITNGTIRLGANINIPRIRGASPSNYDLGSTAMLWVDGANVNFNSAALVVYGKFRITAGSFTTTGGEGSVIREEGQYLIEGGTFTTEKFRPSNTSPDHRGSFTMSGGVFNATGNASNDVYARFSHPYPEQVFIMTGGTINVSNPETTGAGINGGIHIGCKPSNYTVTGGTINAILSGGATYFDIASTVPFWNLNISRVSGGPATARLSGISNLSGSITAAQPLRVLNEFSISGANSPTFNANGLQVTVGGNFLIESGATYTPANNTTTFNGASDQLFSNSGTITTGLGNMEVNKSGGTLSLGGSTTSFTVLSFLNLIEGVLNDAGKTVFVNGNINNDAFHTGTGSITMNGTSTQQISGDGTGVFGNLRLLNSSNPGARTVANMTISGVLTLDGATTSIFDIGIYRLSFSSTSAAAVSPAAYTFGSSRMIRTAGFQSDGGVRKTYGNTTAFTFPFGSGTTYTPATIRITSAPTTYGEITARPVNSRHPLVVAGNTSNLTWYWKVTSTGFTGLGANAVSMTYNYIDANVSPAGDDANYIAARYNTPSWTVINTMAAVNETTNQILFNNVGYIDGEYTAGVSAAFGIVRIFYSKRSGNWTNVSAGTTPWSNVSHTGADATVFPTAGDQVYIGNGTLNHTITISNNNQSSGGLEIAAGSTLDVGVTTGHNFGAFENQQIAGSGRIRISSATATAQFPAGDFGNFIRASGGTVEYYSTGTVDFTIPTLSAGPTNLPLNSYRHLILTPATGRFITMPNGDLRIYGNMLMQGASATAIGRFNSTASRTLTIDGGLTITSGTMQFMNGTSQNVELLGTLTVNTGAALNHASSGTTATNEILFHGNVVNNGTIDLYNTASYVTNVTFTGASNASVTGTGSTTDFSKLIVSKGTNQTPVLEVNATAFSLSGASPALNLVNGTFRLTSAQTITIATNTDFNIPATARLSANGGTLQLTGGSGDDLQLSGTLEILSGTVNVGTNANDNSIEYAATGSPTINASGGTLNINGQVRRSAASGQGALLYNQSGSSVVNVALNSAATGTRGVFEILNPGSQFNMSGGMLRISRPAASIDLFIQPTGSTVTGGTIEIGMPGLTQTIDINTTVPLYSLTVVGTSTVARLETYPLVLRGSLEIQADGIFNANSLNVSVAGNFTNLNTSNSTSVSGGGYRPGSNTQTTTLNGSANNQIVTGANGNLTAFANLIVNNTFPSGVVTLQPNTNIRVNGNLTLTAGTVAGGANTITAVATVSNSATHTSTGAGSVTLAGTTNQFITGNGNGVFGNVVLANNSGATFGANQQIAGTLTFTSGALSIGSYRLNLSSPSLTSIVGATATRYIITSGNLSDAGITKAFPASTTGAFTFPIGVPGKYTPATYTITTGASAGSITLKPVNSKHPNATGSGTAYINYYWSATNNGLAIASLTHRYTYLAVDESGNINNYLDARFQSGVWTIGVTPGNPNIATRVITFTNTDLTGDYTAGEATAFVNPTTYRSIASGSWNSDLSVWDVDPPGTNLGPPAGSFVIITEGTTVTVPSNNKRTSTLEVRGRLHLGTTTGHDFGLVTAAGPGNRTIQLQSSTFPSGNFTSFTAAGGGTIEYNGLVSLPAQAVYNNLSFTGTGTKTLASVNLTINGSFTISSGTVDNTTSNGDITFTSATGDFTNNGVFNMGTGAISVGRHLTNTGTGATFNAGNGTDGLTVGGNLVNSLNAVFVCGTDSVGVRGSLTNSATFNGNAGAIRISGNLANTAGTFSASSGILRVIGSVTNNANYNAGPGTVTITGSFTNNGAGAVYTGNSNTTSIGGNFINSAGGVFHASSGNYAISGNWTNSATFNGQTSSVSFVGSFAQISTGATSFYNVSKVNGGSLSLNNNITVTNLLTLSSGNIITGGNTVSLTNTSTQPVTGYSAGAFIDGGLLISYPNAASTSRTHPVGSGTIYRPVTIQQTAASTNAVVRVRMINTPPTGSYPVAVGILSEARYYSIDRISGTMNSPTIELSFNTNGVADENVAVPGNARIMRATAGTGPWTDEGGSGVFSPAAPAGYATSGITTIANTTFFTLGYPDGLLPIELAIFTGKLINGEVQLNWRTLTEKSNKYFTIERSGPEIHFDSIAFKEGAGTTNIARSYAHLDRFPLMGRSYYRLKQTDFDGTFSYSDVVTIHNDSNEIPQLIITPNPGASGDEINVRLKNARNTEVLLTIIDRSGKTILEEATNLQEEVSLLKVLKGKPLAAGTYIAKTVVDGKVITEKFIVM